MRSISFHFCVLLLASLLSASFNPGNNGGGQYPGNNGGQGYQQYPGYNGYQGAPVYQQHGAPQQAGHPVYGGYQQNFQTHQGAFPQAHPQYGTPYVPGNQHALFVQPGQGNFLAVSQPTAPQGIDLFAMRNTLNQLSGMLESFIRGPVQLPQQLTQQPREIANIQPAVRPIQHQIQQPRVIPTVQPVVKPESIFVNLVEDEDEDEEEDEPMRPIETNSVAPTEVKAPLNEINNKEAAAVETEAKASVHDDLETDFIVEEMIQPNFSASSSPSSTPLSTPTPSSPIPSHDEQAEKIQEAELEPFDGIVMAVAIETSTAEPCKTRSLHSRRLPKKNEKEKKQPKKDKKEKKQPKKTATKEPKKAPKKTAVLKGPKESKKRKRDTDKVKSNKKTKVSNSPAPKKHRNHLESELKDLAYTYERRDDHLKALGRTRGCKEKAASKIQHYAVREAPVEDDSEEEIEEEKKDSVEDEESSGENEGEPVRPISMKHPRGFQNVFSLSSEEEEPNCPIPMMRPRGYKESTSSSSYSSGEDDSDAVETRPEPSQDDHDSIMAELNLFLQ